MIALPFERFTRHILRGDDLPLRVQIFQLICAAVAILCLGFVAPLNLLQHLPLGVNLGNVLLGIVGGIFYWESCRGRNHFSVFLLIAIAMLDVVWFWNAGSQGSITYYYFPVLLYVIGLFRGRARWMLVAGLALNITALFVLEIRFPSLVIPFQSAPDRLIDQFTGIVCSGIVTTIIASLMLAGYDREHRTLRASEERFRTLADLSPDIISIFDAEGRLTFNSAAARKTHGYGPEDLLGRSTFDLIHPEDRPGVQTAFAATLDAPATPVIARYRYRNADGSYAWMEAAGRNELGNPHLRGVIAISRDISDRLRAEQALRESENSYRLLFAGNPHPMMIFDLATLRFLEVNAMAVELYGYSRDEFLALTIREIRPPEDLPRFGAILEGLNVNSPGGRVPGVWRHRLKSGRTIDVEIVAHRIEWAGRPAHVVLVHDVTERMKLETKLRETQKLESLGVLAGGIAHDFNNLLTAILGNASLASLDVVPDSPLGESLRLIEESARRAAELCRQMLAYSGRGRFAIHPVDLSRFVQSTVELLRVSIKRNCRLELELSPGLPLIEADTSQLQQVVMNLVINAAEALGTQEGMIRLVTRRQQADRALLETMHLSPELAAGEYVVLEVADSGCGMSAETRSRIFDPFFTTKFTGRGLGLAAVLGIVRGHRGAIRVDSQLGAGTTFTLLFPVAAGASLAPAEPATISTAPAQAQTRTVLVVDDEPSVLATARGTLERYGFHVILANDGIDGVKQFKERPAAIALVLLDLLMPRLGGEGAFREMKAIDPNVRVLLMSGLDEGEETRRFAGLGVAGFVQKPFTAQTLATKVDAALANGNAQAARS